MDTDFSIRGTCETCHRKRWFVSKRIVPLPIGRTAKSQKKMCGECFKKIKMVLLNNK